MTTRGTQSNGREASSSSSCTGCLLKRRGRDYSTCSNHERRKDQPALCRVVVRLLEQHITGSKEER